MIETRTTNPLLNDIFKLCDPTAIKNPDEKKLFLIPFWIFGRADHQVLIVQFYECLHSGLHSIRKTDRGFSSGR